MPTATNDSVVSSILTKVPKKCSFLMRLNTIQDVFVDSRRSIMTAKRMLLAAWFVFGVVPFVLQTRSFLKFASPHKITEKLLAPPGVEKETFDISEHCVAEGMQMAQIWWNIHFTHYYSIGEDVLCHFVVPQYNVHGNFMIGRRKVEPFPATPSNCVNDSYPTQTYFYHGSIGYVSFYEEVIGTYCAKDATFYGYVGGLGTFDMNGSKLAQDTGSEGYRWSYWYSTFGLMWILYRALVLRRSYIACKRYGRRCDRMQETLRRKQAIVFVHENFRLSPHGAKNWQRLVLLYMLTEGLMSDLFLLVATEGVFAWVQSASLGYNLSGVLLLIFELLENLNWMSERTRLCVKRLLFSYESSLLGELLSAISQPFLLTALNRSDLKHSEPTAIAVSYYCWSLVGHGIFILTLMGMVISIRVLRAVSYVHWKFGRAWVIFIAPCCVDNALGLRNKMTLLGGYCWENGVLLYKREALKAFGLLKAKGEDGAEFLVLRRLNWCAVPYEDLWMIGKVSGQYVEPCKQRLCVSSLISFFDRNLGGNSASGSRSRLVHVKSKVLPSPESSRVIHTSESPFDRNQKT